MTLLSMLGVALTGAFLTLLLREANASLARLVPVCTGVLLFLFLISELSGVLSSLLAFADTYGVGKPITASIRAVGLGYVTDIGAGVVRDLGESGIASRIETAGHIAIIAAAIPFFEELMTAALGYLS